ncbi:mitogen-activated protein kinase kinase kinase YODA-like [Rutidosis leptorrhynchoides]|uniref:mitogen-activated protein kinase kinase kinase YODA-like n=1 Tax=Rutidosis leptorrhynchoides TaxID=125765 RepID=UPI003A998BFF
MAAILKIASSDKKPSYPNEFPNDGLEFLKKCLIRFPERRSTVDELLNHPFIKSEVKAKSTQVYKQMYSPLSVLDVGLDDDSYELDDAYESVDMGPASKIPFLVRPYNKRRSSQKQCTEYEMMSRENWVTVSQGRF